MSSHIGELFKSNNLMYCCRYSGNLKNLSVRIRKDDIIVIDIGNEILYEYSWALSVFAVDKSLIVWINGYCFREYENEEHIGHIIIGKSSITFVFAEETLV